MDVLAGTIEQSSKVSMAFKRQLDSAETHVVATRNVLKSKRRLSARSAPNGRIQLRDSYHNLSDSEFRARCGEAYVVDIIYGGELNILMTMSESSSDSRMETEAAFEDGNEISGTNFNASMMAKLKHHHKHQRLNVESNSLGGNAVHLPSSPEEFTKAFNNWEVSDSTAAPVYFVVQAYGALRDGMKMLIPARATEMEKIAVMYWRLDNLRNTVNSMTNIDSGVEWALNRVRSRSNLTHVADETTRMMGRLKRAATQCSKNPEKCKYPAGPGNAFEKEYHLRAALPHPVSYGFIYKYRQPVRKELAKANWQYWLKDINDVRQRNDEPFTLLQGQLKKLYPAVWHNTKTRAEHPPVALAGSWHHSCDDTETGWSTKRSHGYHNRAQLKTKCGYYKKPKDIFHKKTHKKRKQTVYFGTSKDPATKTHGNIVTNHTRRSNCNGHLKPKC
ncbi:MAG: hypothetical protein AAF354_12295 [Pseudomonadota bacterium]